MARVKKEKKPTLRALSEVPQDPASASPEHPLCQQCKLHLSSSKPFFRTATSSGWTSKLLAVGEKLASGREAKILKEELDRAGFTAKDVEYRDVVLCAPPDNRRPTTQEWRACRPFLLGTIDQLKPKAILAFGTTALKCIQNDGSTNVTPNRGRLLTVQRKADEP